MTTEQPTSQDTSQPAAETNGPPETRKSPHRAASALGSLFNSGVIIALIAVGLSIWQMTDTRHRLALLEKELAKELAQTESSTKETQFIAVQAQESVREATVKLGVLESKLADSQNQQVALEALYQELSQNRDQWALADVEQILSIASQQLQLSGNVRAALIALQTADNRLQRLDKPQFIGIRKVITKDIERLKALPFVDTVGISLRLDDAIAAVDSLPLPLQTPPADQVKAEPRPHSGKWWSQIGQEAWDDFKQLVQVQRIDQPQAPLLTPSQHFFLRENLKLRLLTARIALLQHDEATYKADLRAAQDWVSKYFDRDAKATKAVLSTLKQLAESPVSIQLPDISDTLDAVRNYKLSRERTLR